MTKEGIDGWWEKAESSKFYKKNYGLIDLQKSAK